MVVEYKSIIKNDVWEMVLRLIAKLVSFTKLSMHMMEYLKVYIQLFFRRFSVLTDYNNNNNLILRSQPSQKPDWCMRPAICGTRDSLRIEI